MYHGGRFQIKGTFSKVHRQQKLSLYLFVHSFLDYSGNKVWWSHFAVTCLGRTAIAVFCCCVSSVRFARLFKCFVLWQTTLAGVQLHIKTVESFPSPLLPLMLAAVCCLLFSLCLLLPFFLYCDAKVIQISIPSKHFTKKVYVLSFVNTKRRKDTEINVK